MFLNNIPWIKKKRFFLQEMRNFMPTCIRANFSDMLLFFGACRILGWQSRDTVNWPQWSLWDRAGWQGHCVQTSDEEVKQVSLHWTGRKQQSHRVCTCTHRDTHTNTQWSTHRWARIYKETCIHPLFVKSMLLNFILTWSDCWGKWLNTCYQVIYNNLQNVKVEAHFYCNQLTWVNPVREIEHFI